MNKIRRIGVLTSGGDSSGMNAAIRAVVRTAVYNHIEVVGIKRGYAGLIDNEFVELKTIDVANIIHRGGTILKSARCEEFMTKEGRQIAFNNLKAQSIDALIVIGGNGTYAGANIFFQEFLFPIIGLPGTIDNDINGTDVTIGSDTALNNAIWAIDKIRDTADAHDRVFFVEVMGRDSGFIGLNTGIAVGAEAILIPEILDDTALLFSYFTRNKKRKKMFSIIIVTEGNIEGNAFEIANKVREKFDYLDIRVSVLGHMQRGGNPTANDRLVASELGYHAVKFLIEEKHGFALGKNGKGITLTSFIEAIKKNNNVDNSLWKMSKVLSL